MLLFLLILIPAVLVLGGSYYGYKLSFYYKDPLESPYKYVRTGQTEKVSERLDKLIKAYDEEPYEAVSICSHDGLRLSGKYYHYCGNAPLEIFFHGYKGSAIRDFCGQWQTAKELGHNVLLVDQRCHGGSEGHSISFGILEREDCLCWIKYACERFGDTAIILSGVSMGAATVLMAAGMDLPENVKCAVADCPFDAPSNIIKKVLEKDMGMPVKLLYPLIRLGGRLYGGFDLEAASPIEALKKTKLPILLIHGDEDNFVPCSMSQKLHAAAPEKTEMHIINGSGHALNYVTAPEQYSMTVKAFIGKHMN